METLSAFWTQSPQQVFELLGTSRQGLSTTEAVQRKAAQPGVKQQSALVKDIKLFLGQFKNTLTLLLIFGLIISAGLGEFTNSLIIFCILLLSGTLGFIQERNAGRAVERLRVLIQTHASVTRDGKPFEVPVDDVVPGDILSLSAGGIVPADCLLVESKDLYINESALTGESFPAEKNTGTSAENAPLMERRNCVFKGTNVISGTAVAVAVATGAATEIGKIETEISGATEETAFEKGLKQFGYVLMRIALILAGIILIVNLAAGKPAFDSLLFALALSLGLSPELLPAIVIITLSSGARRLAAKKVIVKKLSSIQNLGSIDVLCSDKTGTLTEGVVQVNAFLSPEGKPDTQVQLYAYLNASFESGYSNPMDEAIRQQGACDISGYTKFDEVPYDFMRKRLSIVAAHNSQHIMVTKGALQNVLEVCTQVSVNGNTLSLESNRKTIEDEYARLSQAGYRVIGIAIKDVTNDPVITKDDECDMTFAGLITLADPLKQDIKEIISNLKEKHIGLKIITGDNTLIAKSIATQIGIDTNRVISGSELAHLSEQAIAAKVSSFDIFSETDPAQKERIIKALQRKGHVVGYIGDGINDASALKAADVGISVNNAVDVAKESADMILLEKGLNVVSDGVLEGRKTYLNTLKYIFITISANFGNMFSMAGASLLLPFLPLLPSQILLTNFLTDLPALAIASDNVDREMLKKPRRWNMRLIRNFMIVFGLESSVFDFITFGLLILVLQAGPDTFRTGWFIESVVTEILILLIIRTRRTFIKSLPGRLLLISSLSVIAVVLALPYFPWSSALGLVPLPAYVLGAMLAIAVLYAITGEITKKLLFKKLKY